MDIVDLSEKGWVTPESSKALRSRVEVLLPMEEIGEHTTGEREEILIILEGEATIQLDGEDANLGTGFALFIPPKKVHNVKNLGQIPLRYMYVVSLAK